MMRERALQVVWVLVGLIVFEASVGRSWVRQSAAASYAMRFN